LSQNPFEGAAPPAWEEPRYVFLEVL
jgi:hypothetical protein